jgi:hypothetical protein
MRPYLHDEICKIIHTDRSYSQVVDLAAHGHRTSSISADGLEDLILGMTKESLCLAMRQQSILNLYFSFARAFREWREKAWW